ncbi:MAG: hypothetical protein IAI49_15295 [Candidatus Eremiobacteraeota bacterium]|nr:hypothetical protein [Candidatus Eremiobacteraeota bacterium]
MSSFPPGLPIDSLHTYRRDRAPLRPGPPATQIVFAGTRESLSSTARFDMGDGGAMIDASELIWIDLDSYNGVVDVRESDVILEIDSGLLFTIVAAENPSARVLKITAKAARRGGPA